MDREIETLRPNFEEIVLELPGSEGPVFDKNGVFYMVAPEIKQNGQDGGQILRVNLTSGQWASLCETKFDGIGGIPAGCQCDKNNNLWIADMRHGLLKVEPNGIYHQIATMDSNGNIMQGCNDLIFDNNGNLWITAPAGPIAPAPLTRSIDDAFGSIYCFTNSGKMIKADSGFQFPNGITIKHNADGQPHLLLVAETMTKNIWSYDILGPGRLGTKKLWGTVPGDHDGGPNGMDLDCMDNLLVTNWGLSHIEIFGPQGGNPFLRIKCPFSKPSNLHFQPGTKNVYITENEFNGLWKFEWKYAGQPLFCEL